MFGITGDVTEAHRQVPVSPVDWPRLAFRVDGSELIFVNTVGTYYMSSAAYGWGRLGAALCRLGYYVLGHRLPAWILSYVDDWLLLVIGSRWMETVLVFYWLLAILRVSMTWKKSNGGIVLQWVGRELDVRTLSLG